ncbi:MAG: amidohydrolase family protein [Actinomycetota bacterium]
MSLTVRGTFLHTPTPGTLEVLDDHLVIIDDDGVITEVVPAATASGADGPDVVRPGEGTMVLPGLIDTHVHAPQWPQLATGLDLSLDRWLFDYTFPLEARYADADFARSVWAELVPSLLATGTTTAVYYGSIHEPATTALAEACVAFGQRAFVGRVAMDHPEGAPEWYRDDSATLAVEASARSVEEVTAVDGGRGLVRPILTPRFIPACTDALLTGMGELAAATGVLVQTHCSEGDWEHTHVLERCGVSDATALDRFGLVRDHTVLAHGTHLGDDDRTLLIERGAGVAHCPLSNAYFANAVFPAARNIAAGLRVGLGTDIAAGPSSSMLDQCRHAVTVSRLLDDGVDVERPPAERGRPGSRIDIPTAFWMATVGGADLLGLPLGRFAPGCRFDAFVVDPGRARGLGIWDGIDDSWERRFEKVVRASTAEHIATVWVDGREVTPTPVAADR